MFCSYRISTDNRVARSLCHSRATCSNTDALPSACQSDKALDGIVICNNKQHQLIVNVPGINIKPTKLDHNHQPMQQLQVTLSVVSYTLRSIQFGLALCYLLIRIFYLHFCKLHTQICVSKETSDVQYDHRKI